MAYTLDNLRTDIRNYTEVSSSVLSDSVLDTIIKNAENKIYRAIDTDQSVFYATSNIRHLISSNSTEMKQLNTVAQKDHLNETISLSDRFGLWIGFHNIDQNTYLEIIDSYLKHFEIDDINNEIRENSLKWSIQRGSRSGRVAWQYIVDVAGKLEKKISF